MAADWIKMRNNLDTDPRIIAMAAELSVSELHVVGMLWKVWSWADQHTFDGNAIRVTDVTLNRFTSCAGFAHALRNVGWLTGEDGSLCFPRFAEHNGLTAKKRAETAERVRNHRKTCNANSVTDVTQNALPDETRRDESIPDRSVGSDPIRGVQKEEVRQAVIRSLKVLQDSSSIAISPLPAKSLSGGAFAAIKEQHLDDTRSLSEWFARQLSLPDPVCPGTRADLLLVLAAGIHATKLPSADVKKRRCAIFVDLVSKGRWRKVTPYVDLANQNLLALEGGRHDPTPSEAK